MRLTLAYCLTIAFATAAFDAAAYWAFGWRGTISYLTLSRSQRYAILPFLGGILAAHLFWPESSTPRALERFRALPILPFLAGILAGRVLWPQPADAEPKPSPMEGTRDDEDTPLWPPIEDGRG